VNDQGPTTLAFDHDGRQIPDADLYGERPQPRRQTTHAQLYNLDVHWLPRLHDGLSKPEFTAAWRSRGKYIPTTNLEKFLTDGVHDSLIVVGEGGRALGLVELMSYSPVDQRAEVSAVSWVHGLIRGRIAEGIVVSIDEWFWTLNLQTISCYTTDHARNQFGKSLDRYFSYDGKLRNHLLLNGHLQDVSIYSMTRDEFRHAVTTDARLQSFAPEWRALE
jgi:hypothetical protein